MKQVLVTVFLLCIFAVAADAPQLTEAQNDKLMSAFKSAVMAQQTAQNEANKYNALANEVLAKFPKGTQLRPDLSTDKVTVVLPAESKKQEPEKK